MVVSFCSQNTTKIKQTVPQRKDSSNTTAAVAAGGTGYVAANSVSKYPAAIKKVSTILNNSKILQLEKKQQLLSLMSKCGRLSKYAKNPLVSGAVGIAAFALSLPMIVSSLFALTNVADGNLKIAV